MPNHDNESFRDGSNEIAALSNTAAHLFRCSITGTRDDDDTAIHLNQYIEQLQAACEHLSPSTHESLAYFFAILEEGLELLIAEKRALTKDESSFLQKIPGILSDYILLPGSKIPGAKFLKHLKNKYWIRPISVDEEKKLLELLTPSSPITSAPKETSEYLPELISEPDQTLNTAIPEDINIDAESTLDLNSFSEDIDGSLSPEYSKAHLLSPLEKNDTIPDVKLGKKVNTLNVTEQQQELITLICDELDEIIEDDVYNKIPIDIDITELNTHLISTAELIERIGNAIDMIELEGLGNSCRLISSNVHLLATEKVNLKDAHRSLIEKWPALIHLYLKDISYTTHFSDNAAFSIIKYLADSLWLDPLTGNEKLKLQSLLTSPRLKEEKNIRQNTARTEDISLELPDDVNNELLDTLLLDLPVQTEEFSNALQNMHTRDDIKYLDAAQRVAHTLKGASNVVGVKGIANLTHHLEDILEIQSKAKKLPSTELHEVLSDAADCLETMSEALLGINTPPDNSQEIFQDVLDWANKLDTEGATQKQPHSKSEAQTSPLPAFKTATPDTPSGQAEATNHAPSTHSLAATLRVPVTLVDELLRLSGENLISTSQVQEHIKTIKTRYNGLKTHNLSLQKLSFNLEHIIDIQGILNNKQIAVDEKFDPLELDKFHELHGMSRQLVEIAADAFEITQSLEKDIDQLQGLVISQNKLQKESQNLVLRTCMVPAKTIIPRLKRGVKQTCRQTNKWVELEVLHNNTQMDNEVLHQMIEPIMHILRNAIDHGIESADQRTEQGKNPTGLIKLTFTSEGDRIKIEIKDDGQGLDTQKIKDKAIKLGIINQQSEVDLSSLYMLILSPGFTTQNEVSPVSGRGIGLDVVNSHIRELKGSLEINSSYRKGCTFTLMLPVSSFTTQSLLIRVRKSTHTLSNRGIEEILYPGHSIIKNLKHETFFNFKDKTYNICLFEDLLNLPKDRRNREEYETRPIILIKDDTGGNMAILVQEIFDSQNVVVKSMGSFIPKIPGVIGAAVLGDGSVSPVIDIPELLQSASVVPTQFKYPATSTPELTSTEQQTSYILVVDDSLSARKSLAQFVQDLGLEVHTARDGMEAISLIEVHKPDLILVDMEMPRMNGLELTSHIRANADTHDMPIVMITSRSTEKHRTTAFNRGVNHYMVKPFEEDELAMYIQDALNSA